MLVLCGLGIGRQNAVSLDLTYYCKAVYDMLTVRRGDASRLFYLLPVLIIADVFFFVIFVL